uniref:Putative HAD-like domain-containing protein n=1 Tax=Helianthus annuus TaxID=4232 RepID=A0A251VAS2_HELAN
MAHNFREKTGFNGGIPIDEDFFAQNISGMLDDDIAAVLFPNDIERVSGIKAGVAAGMPVIGLTTRNPKHMLMKANPTLLIENYEDPKLWEVLGELNKRENEA